MFFLKRELLRSYSLSYADPILPLQNEHLPEPSEVDVEDFGFSKLAFLPWKET